MINNCNFRKNIIANKANVNMSGSNLQKIQLMIFAFFLNDIYTRCFYQYYNTTLHCQSQHNSTGLTEIVSDRLYNQILRCSAVNIYIFLVHSAYIALYFGEYCRSGFINYSINFLNNIEICFVVSIFYSSSSPRNIRQLTTWEG